MYLRLLDQAVQYLFIFIGGGLGSLSRYLVSTALSQGAESIFPYGTLAVNVAGSFLIGLAFSLFQDIMVPSQVRALLTIGFLGGFTTFSTFSLETLTLLRDSEYKLFAMNLFSNNFVGLLFALGGIVMGRMIISLLRQV
jgi:CrcB protein